MEKQVEEENSPDVEARVILTTKKKVFSNEEDLMLLREVYCERPFIGTYKEVPRKWKSVQQHLHWTNLSIKTIRGRFDTLLSKYTSDQRRSLLSSGTEENYDEKCQLLGHIVELKEECSEKKATESASEKVKEEEERTKAMNVRDAAMNGMIKTKEKKSEEGIKSKSIKSDEAILRVYKEKFDTEKDNRREEIEFKKLKLQTLVEERQKDREVEMKRLEIQEKLLNNQNSLMLALLEKISNK